MPTQTHPLSAAAGHLFDAAVRRLGAVEASRFMFSAHADLDGFSPVQYLKAGRFADVHRVIVALKDRNQS